MEMVEQIVKDIITQGWSHRPVLMALPCLDAINTYFNQHQSNFVPAQVGQGGERQRREDIRGDFTHWIDPLSPPEAFRWPVEFLMQLQQQLNQKCFMGLKQFECHLASYPPGSFYRKHLDHFQQDSSRYLSFVFYLNPVWSPADAGELILYDKDDQPLEKIYPMPGSAVFFLSHDFPHEVKPGLKERRSLTGWMHTKNIY
jgi:SM-20-related protein